MAKVMEIRMGLGYLNDFSWLAPIPEAAVLSIGFDTMMRSAEALAVLDRPVAAARQRDDVIGMRGHNCPSLLDARDAVWIPCQHCVAPLLVTATVAAARWAWPAIN